MLLELLNTLTLVFIATESSWRVVHIRHARLLGGIVFTNLILSDKSAALMANLSPASSLTWLQSWARGLVAAASGHLEHIGACLGSSGALSLVAVTLALAVLHAQKAEYKWKLWAVLLGLAAFAALWLAEADEHVHHREPLKVLTLLVVFGATCLVDVRRSIPELTIQEFLSQAVSAVLVVLPVCPCLSVLLSLGFLVVVTVLETIRVDPHFLNSTIYYGTLYGPFCFVYRETKRACFRNGYLLPS